MFESCRIRGYYNGFILLVVDFFPFDSIIVGHIVVVLLSSLSAFDYEQELDIT